MESKSRAVLWSCIALALACSREPTAPATPQSPGGDSTKVAYGGPQFLQASPGAPAATSTHTSFWAVRGKERSGALFIAGPAGAPADSTPLVSLTVPREGLDRRPDGSRIARGDSVLITITLVDPQRMIVELEPSGLRFSAGHPAMLTLGYDQAGSDLDHDGVVNGRDTAIDEMLRIWRRERPSDPWRPVNASRHGHGRHIDSDIGGFTQYAIAY